MKNAKDIAKDVINQEHSIVTYQFNGVNLEQGESIISRSTLLLRIFSADNFIILRTKKQKELGFNEFKSSLEGILGRGIEHEGKRYKILGASSSLKDGKLWMADQNTIQNIHSYFASSQEALSYLGVFTSNCHDGIFEIETEIEIVEDGHSISETLCTGDGMGFIPISLLRRLDLPCNQLQVRLIAKQWLAKGTLHPYSGNKILLPKSMIKGKNIPLSGNHSFLLGIRAIAQNLSFRSNWTLMQFMNEETIKSTIPKLKEELDTLDSVLTNRESALRFLGTVEGEERMKLERLLTSRLSPTHPYLNHQLRKHLRTRYKDLALGSSIKLTGYTAASGVLEDNDTVCIPNLDERVVVITRYPIRDWHSFRVVINQPNAVEGATQGSIYLNDELVQQLDGDYDGDLIAVIDDEHILDCVLHPDFGRGYKRMEVGSKMRKNDSLNLLPYIASESATTGNRLGYITYLVNACILSGKEKYIPTLSAMLQQEVQSLKWDTHADHETLEKIANDLSICEVLRECKFNKKAFTSFIPELPEEYANHPLFIPYNEVQKKFKSLEKKTDLLEFRYAIPPFEYCISPLINETKSVVQFYNSWISELLETNKNTDVVDNHSTEDLNEALSLPIQFLEKWGKSKANHRNEYAACLWSVVHERSNSQSIGSAAFHVLEDEMIDLLKTHAGIQHQESGIQQPVSPAKCGESSTITIVGGYYDMLDGSLPEKRKQFRTKVKNLGRIVEVDVCPNPKDKTGLDFYCKGLRLGSLPMDQKGKHNLAVGDKFEAFITQNGKAVYLHLL